MSTHQIHQALTLASFISDTAVFGVLAWQFVLILRKSKQDMVLWMYLAWVYQQAASSICGMGLVICGEADRKLLAMFHLTIALAWAAFYYSLKAMRAERADLEHRLDRFERYKASMT